MTRQYVKRNMVESQELDIPQEGTREFAASGELNQVDSHSVDGHHAAPVLESLGFDANGKRIRPKKWYDEMAFMNEMVTVRIHPSTDRNAHPLPDVYVNGRVQRFPRGEELAVRRCFVEVLARSRLTTFDNQLIKDASGNDKYVYPAHTAEVYPFTVIGDSAKGEAWLKNVMRSAR
jgi:hypothetical protein